MTVLAGGAYRYARDGAAQSIVEPWELSQDGAFLCLRGERLRDGRALLRVDAAFLDGRCTMLRLDWLSGRARSMSYWHRGNAVEWQEGDSEGTLALPDGGLLFPLLRAATGPLVLQLVQRASDVVVPGLLVPTRPKFLQPEATRRRAYVVGDHFTYYGGEYGDEGCKCWIDESGLLQRYAWATPTGTWDVQLEGLWTGPGYKGFR